MKHTLEKRESAIPELHCYGFSLSDSIGDLQEVQGDWLILTEHVSSVL